MDNGEFQAHTQQIEQLVQRVNSLSDEDARRTALDLLQSTMDLHGAVMARIVEVLSEAGESGRTALRELGRDPLVCGLLVLYGVHPVAFQDRVAQAIERVRPKLHKQGATVELISALEDVVRVKVQSSGNGCGSSPEKLKAAVEQAIAEVAPEIAEIVIEGIPSAPEAFVPLNMIHPASREENRYEESTA